MSEEKIARILGIEVPRIVEAYVRDTGRVTFKDPDGTRVVTTAHDPEYDYEGCDPDYVDVKLESGQVFRTAIHAVASVVYD